jgi:hypothetical protein
MQENTCKQACKGKAVGKGTRNKSDDAFLHTVELGIIGANKYAVAGDQYTKIR